MAEKERKGDFLWERVSGILLVAILVILPIGIFKYNAKIAQGYPGKVINVVARNDNRPGETGHWMVQRGLAWDYADTGAPHIIRVNQGETVTLRLTAVEVVHGFSLPEYGIDETVYPGKVTTVTFQTEKPGEFLFTCSVYCGLGHYTMVGRLIVEPTAALAGRAEVAGLRR